MAFCGKFKIARMSNLNLKFIYFVFPVVGLSAALIAVGNVQLCTALNLPLPTQSQSSLRATNTLPVLAQQTPAPEYLNPNPNPLILPTKPQQVQVRQTEPITLQQALDLARRNNLDLQTTVLNVERSRALQREAEAAKYPTLNLDAGVTRRGSAGNQVGNQR